MGRRSRKNKDIAAISQPTGPEWLFVNGVQLWLPEQPEQFRNSVSIPNLNVAGAGWAVARSALNFILQCSYQGSVEYRIDWVAKIGRGLSTEVYRADVTVFENKKEKYQSFAVSLLLPDAEPDASLGMIKAQFLLDAIGEKPVRFSVPKPVGMVWHDGRLLSAASFVAGLPVELRASRSPVERPWAIVATIAAEIHELPMHVLPQSLERYDTWQDHAVSAARDFKKFNIPQIQDALNWLSENLPPKKKSVLIHGDLLGQNILRTLTEELFVIDWEYAFVGDPAYDLAIVTRGVKKPFQVSSGLDRLIDAYLSAGGQELSKKDVHVYELLLCLGWYEQSLDRSRGGESPDHYLNLIGNLLRRSG